MDTTNEIMDGLGFDLSEFFTSIHDFLNMISEEVMNSEMTGLIMYLFGCLPEEIRTILYTVIILAVILALYSIFKK